MGYPAGCWWRSAEGAISRLNPEGRRLLAEIAGVNAIALDSPSSIASVPG
jgi:hypothetical protein